MTEDGKLRIYLAKNGSPIKFYDVNPKPETLNFGRLITLPPYVPLAPRYPQTLNPEP